VAGEFRAEPDELRAVAGDLSGASARIKAVIGSLRAQLAGESAGTACALSAGDTNSFHAQCEHVQSTVDPADTGVLDLWANHLKHAADVFEESDQG
jgi:uncharacterized protein YukE